MEIRRAADAMLRCQTSPIVTLLTSSRCQAQAGRRAFTQTCRPQALSPRITTTSRPARSSSQGEISRNLDWTAGRPGLTSAPSTTLEQKMDGGGDDSMDDILNLVNEKAKMTRLPSKTFDYTLMKQPRGARPPGALGPMREIAAMQMPKANVKVPLRLNPRLGRTVTLGGNVDLGRAIRLLEQSCARNKVRRDFTAQRFHERPGLKRKRVKASGWRKRFRQAFSATVRRVKELKKQGW